MYDTYYVNKTMLVGLDLDSPYIYYTILLSLYGCVHGLRLKLFIIIIVRQWI